MTGETAARAPRRSIADVVLGMVGGAMVLLAVLSAVLGREGSAAPAAGPPAVEILTPADEELVSGRLEIVFRPEVPLEPYPAGWGTADYHIHLDLSGRELMPGRAQIVRLPGGEYRWSVGQLPPGQYTLRLFWSDAAHRPVEGGASGRVNIAVH